MSTNLFLFFFHDASELLSNELEIYSNMRIEAIQKHPELFTDITNDPDTNYKYLSNTSERFPKELLEARVKVILEEYTDRNQLHPGVLDSETQSAYYHKTVDDLLRKIILPQDYNCLGFHAIVREILANTVLKNSILSCDSSLFNEIICNSLTGHTDTPQELDEELSDEISDNITIDIPLVYNINIIVRYSISIYN